MQDRPVTSVTPVTPGSPVTIVTLVAACGLASLALAACADPEAGRVGRPAPDDDAADGRDDGCPAGAALERIAERAGPFALGPCGQVAAFESRDGERWLVVFDGDHERLTELAIGYGYGGSVALSPSGRRVAWGNQKSDLGSGDGGVGAVAVPLIADATFAVGAAEVVRFTDDERLVEVDDVSTSSEGLSLFVERDEPSGTQFARVVAAGERLYFATEKRWGAQGSTTPGWSASELRVLDIADGTMRPLGVVDLDWRTGDDGAVREGFVPTGEGSRVVLTVERETAGMEHETRATGIVMADGTVLFSGRVGWRRAARDSRKGRGATGGTRGRYDLVGGRWARARALGGRGQDAAVARGCGVCGGRRGRGRGAAPGRSRGG